MKNIAFFGLGNMGLPVALNLLKAGYSVTTAVHQSETNPSVLEAAGGKIAESKALAIKDAELIFTMLTNDASIRDMLLDPETVAAVASSSVIVDLTSSSARVIREVASVYGEKGVSVIDAPVSGGVKGATTGTLTLMCGGDVDVFNEVKPVLEAIAKNILYLGPVGTGKMIKSMNNLFVAANIIMTSEAVKIIEKNGIDPETFYETITKSTGNSFHFQRGFHRSLARDFSPTFALSLMKKDIGLALDLADDLYVPMSRTVLDLYEKALPYSDEDCTAVMRLLDEA